LRKGEEQDSWPDKHATEEGKPQIPDEATGNDLKICNFNHGDMVIYWSIFQKP
jgi:hypothetical protein